MVISVPRTNTKVAYRLRTSPQKFVPWNAVYFSPDDSDRPGHVPISSTPLLRGDGLESSARMAGHARCTESNSQPSASQGIFVETSFTGMLL